MTQSIITLTTDFGPDLFVGQMKGVILGICPQARLVDLSHAVPPQDVRAGGLVLEQAWQAFPKDTVHLAVVDPGVGTARKGMALAALGMLWVGPDNGLFTPLMLADPGFQAWELSNSEYFRLEISASFHGRDIFAPVAAHLALGAPPERMGPPLTRPVLLEWPQAEQRGGLLLGQVVGVDHFGNLTTNLSRHQVERFLKGRPGLVRIKQMSIPGPLTAYAQVSPGQTLALFDSGGRLELAVNQGDMCRRLGVERGEVFGLAVSLDARDL